jgi:hypothetical protein
VPACLHAVGCGVARERLSVRVERPKLDALRSTHAPAAHNTGAAAQGSGCGVKRGSTARPEYSARLALSGLDWWPQIGIFQAGPTLAARTVTGAPQGGPWEALVTEAGRHVCNAICLKARHWRQGEAPGACSPSHTCRPLLIMRASALPPPPPTPSTLMRALLPSCPPVPKPLLVAAGGA